MTTSADRALPLPLPLDTIATKASATWASRGSSEPSPRATRRMRSVSASRRLTKGDAGLGRQREAPTHHAQLVAPVAHGAGLVLAGVELVGVDGGEPALAGLVAQRPQG